MSEFIYKTLDHAGCRIDVIHDPYAEDPEKAHDNVWSISDGHDYYRTGYSIFDGNYIGRDSNPILQIPLRDWEDRDGEHLAVGGDKRNYQYGGYTRVAETNLARLKYFWPETGLVKLIDLGLEALEGEVWEYSNWLRGNCWGWRVSEIDEDDETGPEIDACWGYIADPLRDDFKFMIDDAKRSAEHHATHDHHQ